jgi:RsiW-degrading membrane proteinase PrsW (M82 family)
VSQPVELAAQEYTLEECPHCGELVPPGAFCGNCGAHFSDIGGKGRIHHYAAAPHEHVVHTAVISTLFPHLARHHAHIFRETFVAGLGIVVLLGALRLYTPALLAAALLLPVLYLVYLYEVEVYESEPVVVLIATFGVGAVLGVAFALGFGHLVSGTFTSINRGPLFSGVLMPVVGQVAMLVGPVLLLTRPRFREVLDGLSFGVCSALGFTVASVIAGYWDVLTTPLVGAASISTDEIANIIRAAILAALVNAATTGTVCASLWLTRYSRSRKWHTHVLLNLPAAVVIALACQVGLGLISYFVNSLLLDVALWAIASAALLVWVRICIHNSLLEEGAEHNIGEPSACPECHRLVPSMYFCAACGVARSAAPKPARRAAAEAAALVARGTGPDEPPTTGTVGTEGTSPGEPA